MNDSISRFSAPAILSLSLMVSQCGTALGKANNSGPVWVLGVSSLTLKGPDGTIKTEISIGATEQYSSEGFLDARHSIAAEIDPEGHHAIIIEKDWKMISHQENNEGEAVRTPSATVVASFFDRKGKRLWQIPNIVTDILRSPLISRGGEIVLLIQSSAPGCSTEEDEDCVERAVVLDEAGNRLAEFQSVVAITPLMLSPGGKIALIGIWRDQRNGEKIVFRTGDPKVRHSFESLPGSPVLHDNGVVEFFKYHYGENWEILRQEVVGQIKI